jgi:GTP-binding protein HflX
VPYPIIALVGYTNAGKSTLFNRMTTASVLSADMLFATLDPTLRAVALPHGARVILSDTVGFISDLPTMLVAAFRATLEEVIEADVILHVRDVSHEDSEAQSHDVETILAELGIEPDDQRLLEVWNKIDRLDSEQRVRIFNAAERQQGRRHPLLVSALSGEGIENLLTAIESRLGEARQTLQLLLDPSDGAGLSWLYRHSEVLSRQMRDDGRLEISVRADAKNAEMVKHKYPGTTEMKSPI